MPLTSQSPRQCQPPYIIPGRNRPMPPRPLIDNPTTAHINPPLIPLFFQLHLSKMDHSLQNHASYIGHPVSELPTPALVLSKPVLERNTQILLEDVKRLGIKFRPHVKTLKVQSPYNFESQAMY